jgi:HK97 family phage major capsid protein
MAIHKWAVIVPVTEESVTDQNSMSLLAEVVANAQGGFGRAVDRLAITGSGIAGQTYINQTTKSIEIGNTPIAQGGLWKDLNEGLRLLVSDSGPNTPRAWTGSTFDAVVEPQFNEAVDLNGRPLFTDTMVGETESIQRYGRLLGRPSALLTQIKQGGTVGWAGDWSRVFYGLIGDIRVDYDNRATVVRGGAPISAFQNNLVFVRVEARVGVLVADPEDFVKFNDVVANS